MLAKLKELPSIDYTLIRSERRKTIGLQVKKGEVVVRAPFFVDEAFIDTFIKQKRQWLFDKIEQQRQATNQPKYQLKANHIFLFNGEEKLIDVRQSNRLDVKVAEDKLIVGLTARYFDQTQNGNHFNTDSLINRKVEKLISEFYREQAEQLLVERLNIWAEITGLYPSACVIKKYRARWGSCNSKGVVSLNYWLVTCPIEVIDYVVVHELCHLTYLDHSPNFWRLVSHYLPDYARPKRWLKVYERQLTF